MDKFSKNSIIFLMFIFENKKIMKKLQYNFQKSSLEKNKGLNKFVPNICISENVTLVFSTI